MYSRDQPPYNGANLYGVHPFYVSIEEDNSAHGVLFLNSAAQGEWSAFTTAEVLGGKKILKLN